MALLVLNGVLNPVLLLLVLFVSVVTIPGLKKSLEYQGIDQNRDTTIMLEQTVAVLNILDVDDLPKDPKSLVAAITNYGVALNGCSLTAEGIKDSWGNPIQAEYDPALMAWAIRSLGEDGRAATADDIVRNSRPR